MPIVPILILVLLVAGAVALYLSGATWRWYNITLLSLVMLVSVGWFYLAARTLKIQEAWRSEVGRWEKAIAAADKQHDEILHGQTDAEGKTHLGLEAVKLEVEKLLQGRGRLWAQATRKSAAAETGQLVVTIESPAPHGIEKSMLLYVFDDADGGGFLGEYEVTAATANSPDVTLLPALKLRGSELQRIAARRGAHLRLYEVMPNDSHEIYADAVRIIREQLKPDEQEKTTDASLILRLFPGTVPDAVQREFVEDGKAPTGNTAADPNQIWRRVKVLKEITMPLDAAQAKAMQDAGQTLELDEKTQKPVLKIAEGTVLELDPQSAQEQIASGNVEKVVEEGKPSDQVYMRELRDYARVYRDMNLQIEELVRTTAEVNRQSAAVTDSQQKVTSDIAYRKSEQTALTHDLAHYAAEQKLITGHAQALDSLIADIAAKVGQIKASNQQLESQLAALAQQAVQFLNQRAAAPNSNGT
jgi:hypothetical protein